MSGAAAAEVWEEAHGVEAAGVIPFATQAEAIRLGAF